MTLRELTNHVMDRGASLHVFTTISDVYYKGEHIQSVCDTYTTVVRALIHLPEGPVSSYITKDHHIRLKEFIDESDEGYVGVCLYDTATDKTFACDFCSWVDLVDLIVEDRIGLALEDQLAHILWEITFWGYSEETIATERRLLEDRSEEAGRLESKPLSALIQELSGV